MSACPSRPSIVRSAWSATRSKSANAERGEAVVVLQAPELALDGGASPVEVAEALSVAWDAREEATAEGERKRYLIRLCATERDNRLAAALLALGVDTVVVIALVRRARLGLDAASVDRIEQRGDEVGLLPPRRLDVPRERQAGCRTNGGVNLVAVEASTLPGGDGGAVPPGGVRVAEALALAASPPSLATASLGRMLYAASGTARARRSACPRRARFSLDTVRAGCNTSPAGRRCDPSGIGPQLPRPGRGLVKKPLHAARPTYTRCPLHPAGA
jgi:hypothetical protein